MRKNLIILITFIIFILPIRVGASTGNISISCEPSTLKVGDTAKCTVTGSSTNEIMDVSAVIKLSNNLVMTSFELNDMWEGSDFDTGKIDIYTKSGDPVKDSFNIGTLNIKVKEGVVNSNESVSLTDIEFTYDNNEYAIDDASCNVRVPNNVNTLTSLTVSGATFTFKEDTTSYDIEVDSDSTTISATRKDEESYVTGDTGTKSLEYGNNTFTITVTAEDGSKKNYTLNITRPDKRSKENNLLSFEFNGYDIKFNKEKTEYSLELENTISRIGFCDEDSKKVNMLCINEEIIKVSDKAYSVIYLNDVDLDDKYIKIDEKIIEECDDDNCVYHLDTEVVGKTDGEKEEWYIPVSELKVGENVLKVVVTAENETEKTYTFTINRKDAKGNLVEDEINKNNSTGDSLIIVIVVVAVIALGVTVYIFMRRGKDLHK